MEFVRNGFITLFTFLAGTQTVFAKCMLNDKEIPCSELPGWFWVFPVVFGAVGIFGFVFWLWMLIDAIKNEKEDKTMWVVLIILLNLLGAVIYYFVKKRKRVKAPDLHPLDSK